jgi:hypothetical protein
VKEQAFLEPQRNVIRGNIDKPEKDRFDIKITHFNLGYYEYLDNATFTEHTMTTIAKHLSRLYEDTGLTT